MDLSPVQKGQVRLSISNFYLLFLVFMKVLGHLLMKIQLEGDNPLTRFPIRTALPILSGLVASKSSRITCISE